MADPVTISSGALSATVAPLGAELVSLTDAAGRELMSDGDPAFWSGRAPLLFPIVGRLNGDRYRIDGAEYTLPQHGFARRMDFAVTAQSEDHVRFRLTDNPATRAVYPFAFVLEMDFALEAAALTMTATITNPGAVPLPASFGYHPAFAWPLPYGAAKEEHRIVFDQDESAPIRVIAEGLIAPETVASPVEGRTLALSDALFADDALIWDRLESPSLHYGAVDGATLEIAFPDTEWLGMWTKPGAAFLCIEPWAGMADPQGFDGDFRDKPGVFEIAPGASRVFRMMVRLAEN